MIDRRTVFEIHRLNDAGYSARQIARELRLGQKNSQKIPCPSGTDRFAKKTQGVKTGSLPGDDR